MTQESLLQAIRLKDEIIKIEALLHEFKPYVGESVTITVEKKDGSKKTRTSACDDALVVGLCATLEDMKRELCEQFDNLDSQSTEKPVNAITKTAAYIKTWVKNTGHKFPEFYH